MHSLGGTLVKRETSAFHRSSHGLILGLLAFIAIFAWLGSGSLENGDDAVYAWATRQMLIEGSWFDYRWYDSDLFAFYPPLNFVMARLSVTLLGVSEFALRLPASLAAFMAVMLTGAISSRLSRSSLGGLLSGLILLSTVSFYASARSVRMDMTFLAMAMAVYWAYLHSWENRKWLWIAGVFAGMAYLGKSLMVAMFLAPILIDVLWHQRELLRTRELWGGFGVSVAIAASWHIGLVVQGKAAFPSHTERLLVGIKGDFSFVKAARDLVSLEHTLVLCMLGLGFAWLIFNAMKSHREARLWSLAVIVCLGILLATKMTMLHYMLPIFPPCALGAGWLLSRVVDRSAVAGPLLVVALIAMFAVSNLDRFVHADLSPGVKAIAAQARSIGPREPILFFRDYSASFDYYVELDTTLVTESSRAFELFTSHEAMRRGPGIELVTSQEIARRIAVPGTVSVTTLAFQSALAAYYMGLPEASRERLVRKQAGAYVLFYLPPVRDKFR